MFLNLLFNLCQSQTCKMYYDCSQNISLKILHQFMMVRIHLNVKFVTLIFLIRVPWRVFLVLCSVTSWEYLSQMWYTWIQLLSKGLNNTIHISTVHVKSLFLKRSTWRGILHRFMRGRNPLDVRLVTQSLLKRLKWNNILNQFMRKKKAVNMYNLCQNYPQWKAYTLFQLWYVLFTCL